MSAHAGAAVPRGAARPLWSVAIDIERPATALGEQSQHRRDGTRLVHFTGRLTNRVELLASLGEARTPDVDAGDADVVLAAFKRWGESALSHLRGSYVVALADTAAERVVLARDPTGFHPLFFTQTGRRLIAASTPQEVLHVGGRSVEVNRVALADALCRRYPDPRETFFDHVERLTIGSRLVIFRGRCAAETYWSPLDLHGRLRSVEVEGAFGEVQRRAVRRVLERRRPAIFLSGGLDSTSIAAVATDLCRHDAGLQLPVALCLGFPDPSCDERALQRQVANDLGLECRLRDFDAATTATGLVSEALALSATLPAPLVNLWGPAYESLVESSAGDAEAILTGNGGDEWLSASGYLAADLVAGLHAVRLAGFARAWRKAYPAVPLLGRYAFRPLASEALQRLAGRRWTESRAQRLWASDPSWIAPDATLRREQRARAAMASTGIRPRPSFALGESLQSYESAYTSLELEELYELGRRRGLDYVHPYLDPDVVQFCCAIEPDQLNAGGEMKGLLRRTLTQHLPDFAMVRQPKVLATSFYRDVFYKGLESGWRTYGDLQTLADLGVVEPRIAREAVASENVIGGKIRSWDLMNAEAWVRAQFREDAGPASE